MIAQSLKRRIFVNAQDDSFVQCVSPKGFFIGLMIVIVEAAFRQAWLEIRYGAKESRTVVLGSEPISIGSDAFKCIVYAQNAPPVAHRYRLTQGQIVCEDIRSGTTRRLQPGD